MIFLWVLCLMFGVSLGSLNRNSTPPLWNAVYTVKGLLNIPHSEIEEPFQAWYDSKNELSRIDYYGGMVKTYQKTPKTYPPNGTLFKVQPFSNEKVLNHVWCLQLNGTKNHTTSIQPALPDLTGFKYIGTEDMFGSEATKWRSKSKTDNKVTKYTMWVKYKKTLRGDLVPIPVRYEMMGSGYVLRYGNVFGFNGFDHYYIDYSEYDIEDIDPKVFGVDKDLKCGGAPDPGTHHYAATFNPMMEFVYPECDEHVYDEFDRFKAEHKKQYDNEREHEERLNIFRQNLRLINSHNRAGRSFTLAVNYLADRTNDELAALQGATYSEPNTGLPFPYSQAQVNEMSAELPPEFDWRLFGAVTRVKGQSNCGSCWAFGVVGAVEGALFLHNDGHLVTLSEQALMDCSWGSGNKGCNGGYKEKSFEWIKKHGLPSNDDYGGYMGQEGYCHIDNVTDATKIKGWVNVPSNDENALRLAIFKHGPVTVGINASLTTFALYSHGVYYDPKCQNTLPLGHTVLAVGYGIMNGEKYWLIKNSWSNLWGNDGYILVSSKSNNCGVETAPTYVLM